MRSTAFSIPPFHWQIEQSKHRGITSSAQYADGRQ
jgi:hypothetical protein